MIGALRRIYPLRIFGKRTQFKFRWVAALPPRHQRHPLPAARPGPPRPDARAQAVRASQAGGGRRCGDDEWKCHARYLF